MKNIVVVLLVVGLLLGNFSTVNNVYGVEELDQNALNLFLNKFASMDDTERELGAALLSEYIVLGDEGIDQLKDAVVVLISDDQIAALEKQGYDISDIKSELDRLKSWSMDDRNLLVDYIRTGNETKLSQLIKDNEVVGTKPPVVDDNEEVEDVEETVSFNDIESHWAKDNILFMGQKGIINGKGEGKFAPEDNITRSEFAAMIVRLFDLDIEDLSENVFSDINEGDWYYEVALISFNNGIITGKGNNRFAPKENITREEMAVMTMRALELKNLSPKMSKLMIESELTVFNDKVDISSWAVDSCGKSVKAGIITGKSFNKFSPKANAKRAEAATILMRVYDLLNK